MYGGKSSFRENLIDTIPVSVSYTDEKVFGANSFHLFFRFSAHNFESTS